MKTIKTGDKVMYSRQFLQSIGEYTGDMPLNVGVVRGVKRFGSDTFTLAVIDWKVKDVCPNRVNIHNLVLKDKIHLEPV